MLLLVLGLSSIGLRAQGLDSLLERQRLADPREKIYVHFDKNLYNPGDIIWFKAYLFAGGMPSDVSRNVYAELADEGGRVLARVTTPVSFSGASGSFALDSNYAKSALYFRAYTMSMLNSDTSFLYNKAIRVVPKTAVAARPVATAPALTSLSFLPEGGDWVAGIPTTIAFIASDAKGLPVAVSGTIVDAKGVKLADFASIHNGMGKLELTGQVGTTYTARWKDARGKTYNTTLPAVQAEGVSLRVADDGDNKRFTVTRTAAAGEAAKSLHVVATMNGALFYKADINLAVRSTASGLFPTGPLPSGILCITVFDNNYRPLQERVSFVNKHDMEFDADAYLVQKSDAKRALNKLEIAMTDTSLANLSLSVTDADINEAAGMDDNIVSRLLLTSELRGRIENPYYYFYSNNDSIPVQLDLVLLTHGWRRYDWPRVLSGDTEAHRFAETEYLQVQGQVQGLPPGRLSGHLELNGILETAESARSFIVLPVDRKGGVLADGLVFYDTARFYFSFSDKGIPPGTGLLQLQNGLYKGAPRFRPDSALFRALPDVSPAVAAVNARIAAVARESATKLARNVELENITVKGRSKTTKDKMEQKYVSALFGGDAPAFDLVNDPFARNYANIFQYLQGKVAGLQITGGGPSTSLQWRGGSPAIYLNEMQADVEQLASTPMSEIAYVKVFRPGESIMSGGGGGVIAVYTRKGGDVAVDNKPSNMGSARVMGYTPKRVFYSPDYASADAPSVADYRTTLYWAPVIYLDRNRRKARVSFYNNDITKNFRIVLEGFNADGKLIHVEKKLAAAAVK
ncbi:hypothetical protein GCM10028786_34510 [Flaviaesturariibacter terrae]